MDNITEKTVEGRRRVRTDHVNWDLITENDLHDVMGRFLGEIHFVKCGKIGNEFVDEAEQIKLWYNWNNESPFYNTVSVFISPIDSKVVESVVFDLARDEDDGLYTVPLARNDLVANLSTILTKVREAYQEMGYT